MAITTKDVNRSLQKEVRHQKTQESSFTFPELNAEPTVGANANVIFRLVKSKQRRLRIDGICDNVMNPTTKKKERIWLLQGVDSIWQSDLKELLRDKEYVSKNRMSLLFERGICRIPADDAKQIEFARLNTKNVGANRSGSGKFDYYEYNPAEEQSRRLAKENLKINTIITVNNMDDEPMKKLALFLGITPYDELGQLKGIDGMKAELLLRANQDPVTVNKYINSTEVEVAYMVRKAIIDAKIDLTATQGAALWAGGQGFIAKIPTNRKAYEYLTELAMTNSVDGIAFKEQLEIIVT